MGVSIGGPVYARDVLLFLGFVLGLPGALVLVATLAVLRWLL
jgi:hypothetical protein